MKFLELIWAALFRHKIRTAFTLASIVAAFLLFGLLDSVRSAFVHAGEGVPGADRLITAAKLKFGIPLPESLHARIQAVPGVVGASYGSGFYGTYQDPKNFVPVEAYEPHYLDLYPEWYIPASQREAFRSTRTGALAGETLMKKYNWKVGDKISLQTEVPQVDGSSTWTFDLVGIYRIDNPNLKSMEGILYMNWDYYDEARLSDKGTVTWYTVKVEDVDRSDPIAQAIDALSANSDHETRTQSEAALYAEWGRQFADVGLIVGSIMGAVFFTLILLTGNTMAQAVRERVPELGILKTIGFSRRSIMGLVLGESVLLLVLGSVVGLALAAVVTSVLRSTMGPSLPMLPIAEDIWLRGVIAAIVVGLLVAALPAWRGVRLRIVDALSGR
ncbi:membrane protein [Steroidobacter agaridevorans]|uniref:Membrane protein n=1 Tax=Steroidobacter agaridevorans TaxID=2695856 RepID=A0A829YJN8_9GAMM|nr:FtsX-like permease family protein [Steroidobacter agaridevorans]GFE83419.1 membrane protein [Steroidobacter agaridevorans]